MFFFSFCYSALLEALSSVQHPTPNGPMATGGRGPPHQNGCWSCPSAACSPQSQGHSSHGEPATPRAVLLCCSHPCLLEGQQLPHTAVLAPLSFGYSPLHSTTLNYLHYVPIPISLLSCGMALREALSLSPPRSCQLGGTAEPLCTCNCEQKSGATRTPFPVESAEGWHFPRIPHLHLTLGNAAMFFCRLSPGCFTQTALRANSTGTPALASAWPVRPSAALQSLGRGSGPAAAVKEEGGEAANRCRRRATRALAPLCRAGRTPRDREEATPTACNLHPHAHTPAAAQARPGSGGHGYGPRRPVRPPAARPG